MSREQIKDKIREYESDIRYLERLIDDFTDRDEERRIEMYKDEIRDFENKIRDLEGQL